MAFGGHHNQSALADFNWAERECRLELGQAGSNRAFRLIHRLLGLDACSHDESVGRGIGEQMDQIVHSGSIRWLGLSSLVDVMVEATGTKAVVEAGHQFSDGKFSGVISHREQKEFKIDPEAVRSLPSFFWYVGKSGKSSSLYVPPEDI